MKIIFTRAVENSAPIFQKRETEQILQRLPIINTDEFLNALKSHLIREIMQCIIIVNSINACNGFIRNIKVATA